MTTRKHNEEQGIADAMGISQARQAVLKEAVIEEMTHAVDPRNKPTPVSTVLKRVSLICKSHDEAIYAGFKISEVAQAIDEISKDPMAGIAALLSIPRDN